MPRSSTRLSSEAIANIWARRLLEMKVPANFTSSRLEQDVSLSLRLDVLVRRLPDAPLSAPLRAALVGMNAMPNVHATEGVALSAASTTLTSWLKPAFEQRKLNLVGDILGGLTTPTLVRVAIEKVSVQIRSNPALNGELEVALSALLDRAIPMFASAFVATSRPNAPERPDGFSRQNLSQLLGLIRHADRLEQVVEQVGPDNWIKMSENFLDPTTGGIFTLGENKDWLESSMRRVGLTRHVVDTETARAPQRRM